MPTNYNWAGSFFDQNWSTASDWKLDNGTVSTLVPGSAAGDSVVIDGRAYTDATFCKLDQSPRFALSGLKILNNTNLQMASADLHVNGDSSLNDTSQIWCFSGTPTFWINGGIFSWNDGNFGIGGAGNVPGTLNIDGGTLTVNLATANGKLGFGINVGTGTQFGTLNLANPYPHSIIPQGFGSTPTARQIVVGANGFVNITADNTFGFVAPTGVGPATMENAGTVVVDNNQKTYAFQEPIHNYGSLTINSNDTLKVAWSTGDADTANRDKSYFQDGGISTTFLWNAAKLWVQKGFQMDSGTLLVNNAVASTTSVWTIDATNLPASDIIFNGGNVTVGNIIGDVADGVGATGTLNLLTGGADGHGLFWYTGGIALEYANANLSTVYTNGNCQMGYNPAQLPILVWLTAEPPTGTYVVFKTTKPITHLEDPAPSGWASVWNDTDWSVTK